MRLIQYVDGNGQRHAAEVVADGQRLQPLASDSVRDLALQAHRSGMSLAQVVFAQRERDTLDYDTALRGGHFLAPLDHQDAARWLVTGTGLSHLGSASARDSMHAKISQAEAELTDSMKMFKWGLEGGKPAAGAVGTPPEWFYKGDGRCVVNPGALKL